MFNKNSRYMIVLILIFGLLPPASWAGMYMEIKTTGLPVKNASYYFDAGSIRINLDNETDLIYKLEDNSLIKIDHKKRIYRVLDSNFRLLLQKNFHEMKTRMQEMIDKAPSEKRSALKEMMQQQIKQWETPRYDYKLRKTDRSKVVKGYRCVLYEYYNNDVKAKEYCVIPWSQLKADKAIHSTILAMSQYMKETFSEFKYMAPDQPWLNYFSDIAELKGFPVMMKKFMKPSESSEILIEHIIQKAFDPELFMPPPAYRKLGVNIY